MPKEKKTGVVEKIKCEDSLASYIGKTLRSLKTHVDEHRRQSKLGGRFGTSAVAEHVIITGH